MSHATDQLLKRLVVQAQKGDTASFGQIYELLLDDIYKYVYFKVRSEDAHDICEDVFLKVWESIQSYREQEKASFRSWVFKIAHNLIIDYYRKHKEIISLEEGGLLEAVSQEQNPAQIADTTLTLDYLQKALRQLKEEHQQVIVLRFLNDMSYEEMTEIVGKTEGALRIVVHRALQELREILKRMSYRPDKE